MKVSNLSVMAVIPLLIAGFIGVCDSMKPTLAFNAKDVKIEDTSSSWGEVSLETTSINIEVITNEPDLSRVPLKVDCDIYLNEVNVISGLGEDLCIIPYESGSSVHFSVTIDNQNIIKWWVSHINNGEQTEVRIEGKITIALKDMDLDFPFSEDSSFQTDMLQSLQAVK